MKSRLPKGMGGGPSNLNALMKQAQKMQADITALQADIEQREFTASVGGGAVEVVATGKKELKSLTIQPDVVDPEDIEMLQDLIISAVNEVMRTVEDTTNEEMEKITGPNGGGMPGLY